MTDMNFNATVNDTIFQGDMWPFVIFNENNNIRTGRNALFFLQDTTMAIVLMCICLLILFFGIIGNIVTMT